MVRQEQIMVCIIVKVWPRADDNQSTIDDRLLLSETLPSTLTAFSIEIFSPMFDQQWVNVDINSLKTVGVRGTD